MKKTSFILIILLALILNAGMGLREPEETDGEEILGPGPRTITTGPGNDALYEKAAAYTGSDSLSARLGDPDHVTRTFASSDGTLTVDVDADVVIPDADSAPLIRVTGGAVTQAQADALREALVHCTLYETDLPQTKAQIKEYIDQLEQSIQDHDPAEDEGFTYYDPQGNEITFEERTLLTIDQMWQEYEAAPETAEAGPISGKFEPDEGGMSVTGQGESDEYGTEYFSAYVGDSGAGNVRTCYRRDGLEVNNTLWELAQNARGAHFVNVDPDSIEAPACTAEEARALCDPIVEALDIEGMAFWSARMKYSNADGGRCCWELQYTRDLGGLPITYTRTDGDVMTDAPVYQLNWVYEKLTFYVDDSGIVGLWWEAPYDLGEHVTEDAALLSMDDVMAVFEKMFTVAYDNDDLPFDISFPIRTARWDGKDIHVDVNEVRLGYTRIAEMDKEEATGLLVPAWDFFGVITDGDGNVLSDDPEASLLTVNAVDGDIIDRGFGY